MTKKVISLKLDEQTKRTLKLKAAAENRTLHGYIVNLLKNKISEPKN